MKTVFVSNQVQNNKKRSVEPGLSRTRSSPKTYACPKCNRVFANKSSFSYHIESMKRDCTSVKCEESYISTNIKIIGTKYSYLIFIMANHPENFIEILSTRCLITKKCTGVLSCIDSLGKKTGDETITESAEEIMNYKVIQSAVNKILSNVETNNYTDDFI